MIVKWMCYDYVWATLRYVEGNSNLESMCSHPGHFTSRNIVWKRHKNGIHLALSTCVAIPLPNLYQTSRPAIKSWLIWYVSHHEYERKLSSSWTWQLTLTRWSFQHSLIGWSPNLCGNIGVERRSWTPHILVVGGIPSQLSKQACMNVLMACYYLAHIFNSHYLCWGSAIMWLVREAIYMEIHLLVSYNRGILAYIITFFL